MNLRIENCNNNFCRWNNQHKCQLPEPIIRLFDLDYFKGQFFCKNFEMEKKCDTSSETSP